MEHNRLSRASTTDRGAVLAELRQLTGLSAAFLRAAAAQSGMAVTDLQVLNSLQVAGASTAGQLAELTDLTTGAVTAMLNRLEEAGLVHRERDPNDGRRVIVSLARAQADTPRAGSAFASIATAWDEVLAQYDDAQLAVLLDFLQRSNAITRQQLAGLREAPADRAERYSAPLGDLQRGRLVFSSGVSSLSLRAGDNAAELYRARFEGHLPEVKTNDGVVTMRYPRRLWLLQQGQRSAEVALSPAIPWQIVIQGGASDITAELSGLDLAGLELKGGLSTIRLVLPEPNGHVPIRLSGGASEVAVQRPAGVAARVHLKGWVSEFVFDDQVFSGVGNDARVQTPNYAATDRRYDIEVSSSASTVTITAG